MPSSTWLKGLQFVTLIFVALALVPAGAHLFEFPNKIGLPPDQYMVVQQIYRGWALFGFVVIPALVLTLASAIAMRHQKGAALLALLAFLCIAGTQMIFWTYTYPANVATSNWTLAPDSLEPLRRQWEYSHAVNAGLTFAGLVLFTLSVLSARCEDGRAERT